ncbi:MAG: hypothetical protein H7839_24125 [Magnetococcus sp. YQC-5]
MREVADVRVHGTTGEPPIERFERSESFALRPTDGRPPFQQLRELHRKVHNDCCVEVDTNHYSVPWTLIGNEVLVQVINGEICVCHGGRMVARHPESKGCRQRVINKAHLQGIMGRLMVSPGGSVAVERGASPVLADLLRPLSEYETVIGAGW